MRRSLSMLLASIVVFVTVYQMILPALTLELNEAQQTPGIYLETGDLSEEIYSEDTSFTTDDISDMWGEQDGEATYMEEASLYEETEITNESDAVYSMIDDELWAEEEIADSSANLGKDQVEFFDDAITPLGSDGEIAFNDENSEYTYDGNELTAECGSDIVRLNYNATAHIPDGSVLTATGLWGEEAAPLAASAEQAILGIYPTRVLQQTALYKLSITGPEGETIYPTGQIGVTILFGEVIPTDMPIAASYGIDNIAVLSTIDMIEKADGGVSKITFTCDRFEAVGMAATAEAEQDVEATAEAQQDVEATVEAEQEVAAAEEYNVEDNMDNSTQTGQEADEIAELIENAMGDSAQSEQQDETEGAETVETSGDESGTDMVVEETGEEESFVNNDSSVTPSSGITNTASTGTIVRPSASADFTLAVPGQPYSLHISYDEAAGIPEGAEFVATPLEDENYASQALELVNNETLTGHANLIGLFDLTVYLDGIVIAPTGPVKIEAVFEHSLEGNEEIYAVHFPGTGEQPQPEEAYEEAEENVDESYDEFTDATLTGTTVEETEEIIEEVSGSTPAEAVEATGEAAVAEAVEVAAEEAVEELPEATFAEEVEMKAEEFDYTPELLPVEVDGNAAAFETESFSYFAIVGTKFEINILASDGHNYRITAVYGPETGIPMDAKLVVEEIADTSSVYDGYVAKTENALEMAEGSADFIRLFDISIVDRDGKKIQPAAGSVVDIHMELADVTNEEISVVHFADENDSGSVMDSEVDRQTVTFETDGFSVFAVVYTVDFEYSVNGKMYQFSLPGGEKIALSDLIEVLGIIDDANSGEKAVFDNTDSFLKEVENAAFSNETLVKVTKNPTGDDWTLESLAPFRTEESLSITMKNGDVVTVKVMDAQESTDLGAFLTKVTVSGATLEDGNYVVVPGQTYGITMTFKETANLQFDNESLLTYTMPSGISFPAGTETTIIITIVSGGKTYEVSATAATGENGTVTVKFDETDPDFSKLLSATNISFRVHIDAQFKETIRKTEWSTTIDKDIILDTEDHSDAFATKSGTFDPVTGKFNYVITVTSNGDTENVNVKDIISGNALIFNNDVQVSGNSSNYTENTLPSGQKGFDYTFASMADGEVITITYSASLDPNVTLNNGKVTTDQTKNTVTVQKEGGDPHSAEFSQEINMKHPDKTDGTEAGTTEDGKNKIYNWKIDYNPLALVSAAGDVIKDSIGTASQEYMKYYGNVTVKVYNHAGNLVETRSFAPGSDSSWTYTVPAEDTTPYHYKFEYQTVVDQAKVEGLTSAIQLTNEAEGVGGKDTGKIDVGPKELTTITKEVVSSSPREVTWLSRIHVPEQGLSAAVVTDTLPNIWSKHIGLDENFTLYEAYKDGTLKITGLLPGESYEPVVSDDKVVITFYKDSDKTPGLQGTSGGHDITIELTTLVDQRWLQYGYDHPDEKWKSSHENNININGNPKAKAEVVFSKPELTKTGSINGDYYLYTLVLSGVTEEPVVIEDTFDTALLEVAGTGTWNDFKIFGGNQYDQSNSPTPVNYSDTPNGILITANSVPRQDNGEFYPYYKITYYLKLKAGVDLQALAVENGGQYDLTNTAKWGDHTSGYTFTTKYDFLNKEILQEASATNRHVKYKITYNLKKGELNGGEDVQMIDRLNKNLSIDYTSIKIVTDPAGIAIPYSLSGDGPETVATFTIPDSTAVTITYDAMVVGNGPVNYKNTVEVKGEKKEVDKTVNINIEGEGKGAVADLKITKVDGYDANKILAGVKFKLYAADGRSLKEDENLREAILETDADGVLHIDGNEYEIFLGSTAETSVKYYLEEVEAPEGYGTLSFPYQFTLVDNIESVDYENFVYFFSDSFQIKNWPLEGLVVEKQVESPYDSDMTQYYSFKVSILNEDGTVNTGFNEKIGDDTFVNGVFEFVLKDNEQKMFWGFQKGTRYKVEEIDSKGLTTSVTYSVYDEDGSVTEMKTDLGNTHTGSLTQENEVLIFKNTRIERKGALKITKFVQVDDHVPATDVEKALVNGDYIFTVSSGSSILRYVQITVTNGVPVSYKIADTLDALASAEVIAGATALVSRLEEGDYVITEIGKNGMILKEAARGDGKTDAVSEEKAVTVHVTAGQNEPADTSAAAATFTNNIETVTAKVVKVWNHSGNTGTTPTSLTVTLSNGVTKELNGDNNWTAEVTDLPKYDRTTGNLIEYSWTEAELPAGYYLSNIQETTDTATGVITTTLTNSYTDHYNPTTTITGKKVWDDGGEGRPASITVNLYKDGGTTPYCTITVHAPTGEEANQDEWPFEFTNLPVFNSDGSVVQYTVEEVLPAGDTDEYGIKIEFEQATYIAGDATGTIVNSGQGSQTFKITEGFNLGYIVIRHGNDFIIWTQRPATDDEISAIKTKVVGLSDQFNGISSATGSSMKIVSGVPGTVDVGKKHAVSVYMMNGEVWMKFLNPNAWSDFAYGTISYTYTQAGGEGGGTITNTKKNTDIEFGKQWIDIAQQEIEWDQDIQVTVSRNKGDDTKDTSFSLVYNIAKTSVYGATGGTAEFFTGTETDPKLKLTITTESGTKKYSFKIENLAYSSETDGKYTYYVEETNSQLAGYLAPSYTNTSAPTGATAAYDGGTIINKQEGGYELPSTGGPGTRLFTILGSILIAGAGLLLVLKRKKDMM